MKFLSKILLIVTMFEEQVIGISPEQAAAIARLKGLMARLNQAKESFYVYSFSGSFRVDNQFASHDLHFESIEQFPLRSF